MLPYYRVPEVALYSVLSFLPFLFLAMYPFRKHLRFSPAVTNLLVVLITLLQIAIGLAVAFSSTDAGLLQLLATGLYTAFYFIAVKDHLGKLLFTLLALSNVGNLVTVPEKRSCLWKGYMARNKKGKKIKTEYSATSSSL